MRKKIIQNFIYAFLAQFVSMCSSILISLVLPKILGVNHFSYWQLFIFLSTYVGIFHFGLSDGVYLKYGGKDIEEMKPEFLGPQLVLMTFWLAIIGVVGTFLGVNYLSDSLRLYVWLITFLYLVTANSAWYLGYIFQASNDTKKYSESILIARLVFIIFLIASVIMSMTDVKIFILEYLVAQIVSLGYCMYHARSFLNPTIFRWNGVWNELSSNIKAGVVLTLSNITSTLIVGVSRFIADWKWGIEAFGFLSLSLSLVNFALQFIQQVSIVLFPALRKVSVAHQRDVLDKNRDRVSIILCALLVFYYPSSFLLRWWLPQYALSIEYLGLLAPIMVFEGKMQMIYNTYLKVLRKERQLFLVNIVSFLSSLLLCLLGSFVFDNPKYEIFIIILVIMARSIYSELYLYRIMSIQVNYDTWFTILFCIVFIFLNETIEYTISCFICIFVLILWGIIYIRRTRVRKRINYNS